MPRVVTPWTWSKALRDQGPNDRDFLCAMHTLRTWCDKTGSTYVGLRAWANGSRMAVNTLRKHLGLAIEHGWLTVLIRSAGRGKGWRQNVYQTTVPDSIQLAETDEALSECVEKTVHGPAQERPLPLNKAGTRLARNLTAAKEFLRRTEGAQSEAESMVCQPMSDTPSDTIVYQPKTDTREKDRVSNGTSLVCQKDPLGVSNSGPSCVSHGLIHISSESVNNTSKKGRPAPTSAADASKGKSDAEENRAKIAKLLELNLSSTQIARMLHTSGVTRQDVESVKQTPLVSGVSGGNP